MKQQTQIYTLSLIAIFVALNPVIATLNSTNKTSMTTIIKATQATEKLWEQSHESYLRSAISNAKNFNKRNVPENEYAIFFDSFTNMIQKPLPSPMENQTNSLLRLRTLCVVEYARNDEIRKDKKVWISIAKYIEKIRSQIIPDYVATGYPLNTPWDMMPISKERDRLLAENRRIVAEGQYQMSLRNENRSLSGRLEVYMKNLHTHGTVDKEHIQQLMDLAQFNEEERKDIEQWNKRK